MEKTLSFIDFCINWQLAMEILTCSLLSKLVLFLISLNVGHCYFCVPGQSINVVAVPLVLNSEFGFLKVS